MRVDVGVKEERKGDHCEAVDEDVEEAAMAASCDAARQMQSSMRGGVALALVVRGVTVLPNSLLVCFIG